MFGPKPEQIIITIILKGDDNTDGWWLQVGEDLPLISVYSSVSSKSTRRQLPPPAVQASWAYPCILPLQLLSCVLELKDALASVEAD